MCKKTAWMENDEDLRKYTITVHGMKSSLWNINEAGLSELAYTLETGVRERDMDMISKVTPDFLSELSLLLDKLEAVQDQDEDFTDEDDEDVQAKLRTLGEMCAVYDRAGAMKLISEVEHCSKRTRTMLQNIQELVIHSDFEEAESLITAYLEETN